MTEATKAIKRQRQTHAQFFKLCEELRNRREALTSEKPKYVDCARDLAQRLGFPVNTKQLTEAMELTDIRWEVKIAKTKPADGAEKARRIKVIVEAIKRLYVELGVKVSDEFDGLWRTVQYGVNPGSLGGNVYGNGHAAKPGAFRIGDHVHVEGRADRRTIRNVTGFVAILDDGTQHHVSKLRFSDVVVNGAAT